MEILKSWAVSVSAAVVITAIITFISPSGALDKSVKTATALFMLLSFFLPLAKVDARQIFTFDVEYISEWAEGSELKEEVENEVADILKNEIISKIAAYIEGEGIKNSETEVRINISKNYNIAIEKIKIIVPDNVDISGINDFVEKEFSVTPEVILKAEE